jgi:hypothetical protein
MRSLICLALIGAALVPAAARADFIITGGDATVAAGGTGTVDFTITSTNPTVDNLAAFSLELLITPTAGTSFLQFTTSQPDFSTDSSYLFVGNSGAGAGFWGTPLSTNTANDTIAGGDFTADGSGVLIGQSYLLARVQFQADPHASNGDTFHIGLVADPNQTYFLDAGGNSVAYTSNDATVTVENAGGPQAAPAPPSLVLLGIGGVAGLVFRRRGRSAVVR